MKDLAAGPDIATKATKTAKAQVPAVPIPKPHKNTGLPPAVVKAYTELCQQIDALTEVRAPMDAYIREKGFAFVAEANADAADQGKPPISSVRLYDEAAALEAADLAEPASIPAVVITTANRYGRVDEHAATTALSRVQRKDGQEVDPNDYLGWNIEATFDTQVFLGAKGDFDRKRYQLFADALQAVAAKLGVSNPLQLTKTFKVKPTFHAERWRHFDAENNIALHETLPCTVQAKVDRYDVV